MAEVLGIAASGITVAEVAAQVGNSIIKLRQLWHEFKDVPSSIEDLLDQIDCLDPALWEAENTFGQANLSPMLWDNSLGGRSITYCRKALSSLTELVDELSLQLSRTGKFRTKLATAKVVLKKEQLRVLERRLQNAIAILSLAQNSYLIALTRLQPHIIIQSMTESKAPLVTHRLQDNIQQDQLSAFDANQRQFRAQTLGLADDEELEARTLAPWRYTNKRKDAVSNIRFRLPTWMCRATWELRSFRSYGNWQFNLRFYHTLPGNSEVFMVAKYGTPKELDMLFSSGRASPYDRDDKIGDTLLHRAVWGLNRPMVKYLLDIGLSPSESNHYDNETPITHLFHGALLNKDLATFLADWSFADELNKLFDDQGTNINPESKECSCYIGLISKEFLKMFQDHECPWHEGTTLSSRLRNLERVELYAVHPAIIPDLFQRYWTQDIRALCIESTASFSLIHFVACGLGSAHDNLSAEWASLAEIVISNTPNIHHIKVYVNHTMNTMYTMYYSPKPQSTLACLTPLMALIKDFIRLYPKTYGINMPKLSSRVTLWLLAVQSSGQDLEEYGRRENELLVAKGLNLQNEVEFIRWNNRTRRWRRTIACIRGYQYGQEPKDWKILWSFPEKSYSADFWRLVENGPQLVPGAWVEDSDDEEEFGEWL